MSSRHTNKGAMNSKLNLGSDTPIASSRVSKHDQLLDMRAPRRELTQNYQSQPSIAHIPEAKPLSHRSSTKSSRRLHKDDSRKKVKTKSKHLSKNRKLVEGNSNEISPQSRRIQSKDPHSFSSNARTKSTNDTSNNHMHTFTSLSSQANVWSSSQEGSRSKSGTRNIHPNSSNTYSMSPGVASKRLGEDYNFTSADLKSQYLTHGANTSKADSTPSKRMSRKPPMHKKNAKDAGDKSNRVSKKKHGTKVTRTSQMSSVTAIEQILQGIQPNIDPLDLKLPNEESTKYSTKKNGIIAGYAANTNQGIIRTYNEDRVSIILNIVKPKGKEHIAKWPK